MPRKKIIDKTETAGGLSLFERVKAIRVAIRAMFAQDCEFDSVQTAKVIAESGNFFECNIAFTGEKQTVAERDEVSGISALIEYKENIYGILTAFPQEQTNRDEEQFLVREAADNLAVELFCQEQNKSDTELLAELNRARSLPKAIFETTGTATLLVNENSTIIATNREFAALSGYANEEVDGRLSWKNFISREDVNKMERHQKLRSANPASAPRNYEFSFIDRYGEVKDIYGTFNPIPGSNVIIGSFMDITSQKRLESELIRISEQERQRISNDLHDGLGPHLVGVKFMVSILEKKLIGHGMMQEAKAVQEIDTLLAQAIKQIRRLVKGLCPVDIDAEGLIVALEDLTMNTEQVYGVKCSFEHDESLFMTDDNMATHLYLIAQESVNNAIKHSKATAINLTITRQKSGTVLMDIADNGQGFKKRLDNDSGIGINIMKYRARLINASLDIRRNESGGTSVQCFIPVCEVKVPT